MEQQTPIPPNQGLEAAQKPQRRHFPILDLGGGGEGVGYKFPIYFVQDCSFTY